MLFAKADISQYLCKYGSMKNEIHHDCFITLLQGSKAKIMLAKQLCHYKNTPIEIYRKFHLQKLKIFR